MTNNKSDIEIIINIKIVGGTVVEVNYNNKIFTEDLAHKISAEVLGNISERMKEDEQ